MNRSEPLNTFQARVESLERLYFELFHFFRNCGGAYRNVPESTCWNIVDALANGRFLVSREGGEIVRAVLFWKVRPQDLERVKHGECPADRESGDILYLCEHAGTDGAMGLARVIQDLKRRYPQGEACWHDRWVSPDRFRYYRRRS